MTAGEREGAERDAASRSSLVDVAEGAVRRWLSPERFRPGDRLPPEHELARMLGISRGTLRSALRRLEESGEILRRQGSGTFVGRVGPPSAGLRAMHAGSYSARASGREFGVSDIRIEARPATRESAAALAVLEGRSLVTITRTVLVTGRVEAFAHDILHPEVSLPPEDSVRELLDGGETMFEVLSRTVTAPAASRTRISPLLLTASHTLGRRAGVEEATACLLLEEVLIGDREQPLLYSWDVILPGAIEIEVLRSTGTIRPPEPITLSRSRTPA